MAVEWVVDIGYRGGEQGSHNAEGVRDYTQVFLVKVTSPTDGVFVAGGPQAQAMGLPTLYSPHPEDPGSFCISVTPKRHGGGNSRLLWEVECEYSTELPEPEEPDENPLNRPDKVSWDFALYQEAVSKLPLGAIVKADGTEVAADPNDDTEVPIVNSALDRFLDPIMEDVPTWVITIQRNVASVPAWVPQYRNAINTDSVTIGGLTFGEGQLILRGLRVSELQIENDVAFYTLTFEIHQRDDGWDHSRLDVGLYEIVDDFRVRITDDDDIEVASPVRLDGEGKALAADADFDQSVFINYKRKNRLAYAALNLPA